MKKDTDRFKLYRFERFTGEQLAGLPNSLCKYAKAIGGFPKHHYEVFEKRGWSSIATSEAAFKVPPIG
ncbi:hypothetical protein AMQ83_06240, partial [Paenibacillus riograndensis]